MNNKATTIIPENAALALTEFEPAAIKPRYECTKNGVYFIGIETDKDGNAREKPPLKLSDPIELIGRGVDDDDQHYRIIRYHDPISRKQHINALPNAEIGSKWGKLQGKGITILSGRIKRERLADYLQAEGSNEAYNVIDRAGWYKGAYIMPIGELQGKTIYIGQRDRGYTQSGTLEEWRENIGRYAVCNSRLALAIGTALAAPLARLLHIEAGGFHLFGDSRSGKSTAARVALSVWGSPEQIEVKWNGTAYGFSNIAAARNDGFLMLDEIGQAQEAKTVTETAYSVIDGISKIQGAKEGGNRAVNRWRILLLSTGEKTIADFVKTKGKEWNAGQAARLPDIPADVGKGFNVYDTLHGFTDGALLSEHLELAAARYHGTAAPALIARLHDPQTIEQARQALDRFISTLPPLTGQARTVARRFALVAAALEISADITGITDGMASIKQCFHAWEERAGTGKYEDRHIIEQAAEWLQIHAHGQRFSEWNNPYTNDRHTGYRRNHNGNDEYWVIPAVFDEEIAQSYDRRKAARVLHEIGWLLKNGERLQFRKHGSGWFFVFNGAEPPENN